MPRVKLGKRHNSEYQDKGATEQMASVTVKLLFSFL